MSSSNALLSEVLTLHGNYSSFSTEQKGLNPDLSSSAIERFFNYCKGDKKLENELSDQADLIFKQTKKTILHFLVESPNDNHAFIRIFLSHTRRYADVCVQDGNGMTPVDIACRNGKHKKIEALLEANKGHHNEYYKFDSTKKPTPIDYILEIKNSIVKIESLITFCDHSRTAQEYYAEHFFQIHRRRNPDPDAEKYNPVHYWSYYCFPGRGFFKSIGTLSAFITIEICLPLKQDCDAQFEVLRRIDELIDHTKMERITIEYGLELLQQVNFLAAVNVKSHIFSNTRSEEIKSTLTIVNAHALKLKLTDEQKNLYLRSMYLIARKGPACNYQALIELKQLKDSVKILPSNILFEPFYAFDSSVDYFPTFPSNIEPEYLQTFVEYGFTFANPKDEFKKQIFDLAIKQVNKKKYYLIEAMLCRSDNYFIEFTSETGIDLLKKVMPFLDKNNKKISASLQSIYKKLQSPEQSFEFLCFILRNGFAQSSEPFVRNPLVATHLDTSIMSTILAHAMFEGHDRTVTIIREWRTTLIEEKTMLDKSKIFSGSDTFEQTFYTRVSFREECFSESKTSSIEESIRSLPSTNTNPHYITHLLFHSYGFPHREKLLNVFFQTARAGEDNILHKLVKLCSVPDHTSEYPLFGLKALVNYFLHDSPLLSFRNQDNLTPIQLAAKNEQKKALAFLLQSKRTSSDECINPTLLECLYADPKPERFRLEDTYFECARYLIRNHQPTHDEIKQRCGITVDLKQLNDAEMNSLIGFDKTFCKGLSKEQSENEKKFETRMFEWKMSSFLKGNTSNSLYSQTIAICLTRKLYSNNSPFPPEIFGLAYKIKNSNIRRLFLRAQQYCRLGTTNVHIFCNAMWIFKKVAVSNPYEVEQCLQNLYKYAYSKIEENATFAMLSHFSLVVAQIERSKLSRGFLHCRSPEKTACTYIDPFVNTVKALMKKDENPNAKLKTLQELISSLSFWNPLNKAFNNYLGSRFSRELLQGGYQ